MSRLIIAIILFASTGTVYSAELLDCDYNSSKEGIRTYKSCAELVDGKVHFSKKFIRQLDFDKYGMASVYVHGGFYYVNPNGSMLNVIPFDNWADYYSEGLTRSAVNGKIAYYDRDFNQVIAPIYDWGGPFEKGRALVCKGCKIAPPDEEGHQRITGGLWGYINKKSQEIIPVKYTESEAVLKGKNE